MPTYIATPGLIVRQWPGESTAMVRSSPAGRTHLLSAEAITVLQAVPAAAPGVTLREIAHILGLGAEFDDEIQSGLQRIIDGLFQTGLLQRVDDSIGPSGQP